MDPSAPGGMLSEQTAAVVSTHVRTRRKQGAVVPRDGVVRCGDGRVMRDASTLKPFTCNMWPLFPLSLLRLPAGTPTGRNFPRSRRTCPCRTPPSKTCPRGVTARYGRPPRHHTTRQGSWKCMTEAAEAHGPTFGRLYRARSRGDRAAVYSVHEKPPRFLESCVCGASRNHAWALCLASLSCEPSASHPPLGRLDIQRPIAH